MEERFVELQARLEADQGLIERLFSLETPEEVQNILKDEGLEFSVEEINMLRDGIIKVLEKGGNGELSDEDLEDVAGGGIAACTACAIICAGVAVGSGGLAVACGGLAVGTAIGGGALMHKQTNGRW